MGFTRTPATTVNKNRYRVVVVLMEGRWTVDRSFMWFHLSLFLTAFRVLKLHIIVVRIF